MQYVQFQDQVRSKCDSSLCQDQKSKVPIQYCSYHCLQASFYSKIKTGSPLCLSLKSCNLTVSSESNLSVFEANSCFRHTKNFDEPTVDSLHRTTQQTNQSWLLLPTGENLAAEWDPEVEHKRTQTISLKRVRYQETQLHNYEYWCCSACLLDW